MSTLSWRALLSEAWRDCLSGTARVGILTVLATALVGGIICADAFCRESPGCVQEPFARSNPACPRSPFLPRRYLCMRPRPEPSLSWGQQRPIRREFCSLSR